MADLQIRVGNDLAFTARWEDAAPLTREALRAWLPIRSRLIHCRWSGESAWRSNRGFEPPMGEPYRTDLPGEPEIIARLSMVQATERRTVLGEGAAQVHTVEHVLGAVRGLGVDDVAIALDGPEPPAGDGSFRPFVEALRAAGIVERPGEPVRYRVAAPFTVTEGESTYVISPARELRLTVTIDFPHPLIGSQAGTGVARSMPTSPPSHPPSAAAAMTP